VRLDELIDAFDVLPTGRAEPVGRSLPILKHGWIIMKRKCELQIRYYSAQIVRGSYLHRYIANANVGASEEGRQMKAVNGSESRRAVGKALFMNMSSKTKK
jgi:hypothetical protein